MDRLILQLTLFIYIAATAGFLVNMINMKREVERLSTWILVGGFAMNTLGIAVRWFRVGHPPLVSFYEIFSFLAWAICLAFLLFQAAYRLKAFGAFVSPIITLVLATALMYNKSIFQLPPALQSYWLPIHASISLIAYALLTLSFCISVMYLIQEHQIKRKRLGAIFKRLPSLQTLDVMSEKCLKIGFPLLTIGIITGSIWAEKAWGSYWSWDPKETWSLITWFLYAALLHQRLTVGWRGRRSAYMTIIGFLTLLFTFIGVTYLLPGAHSYAT